MDNAPMDAKQAIDLGMLIAEKHTEAVLEMIEQLGATPKESLVGNQVWLATHIMKAMQDAQRALTER